MNYLFVIIISQLMNYMTVDQTKRHSTAYLFVCLLQGETSVSSDVAKAESCCNSSTPGDLHHVKLLFLHGWRCWQGFSPQAGALW